MNRRAANLKNSKYQYPRDYYSLVSSFLPRCHVGLSFDTADSDTYVLGHQRHESFVRLKLFCALLLVSPIKGIFTRN